MALLAQKLWRIFFLSKSVSCFFKTKNKEKKFLWPLSREWGAIGLSVRATKKRTFFCGFPKTFLSFYINLKIVSTLPPHGVVKSWRFISTDHGCNNGGPLFPLILSKTTMFNWSPCKTPCMALTLIKIYRYFENGGGDHSLNILDQSTWPEMCDRPFIQQTLLRFQSLAYSLIITTTPP